jgi:hypothetical protein
MQKTVKIFNEVFTEKDVKAMTLDQISELNIKLTKSISYIVYTRQSKLKKNPKADVSSYTSALSYLSQAQIWIAEIKRHKKLEFNKEQNIEHWFLQIASQRLATEDFNTIYNEAIRYAAAN